MNEYVLTINFWNSVNKFDFPVFKKINGEWHNSFLDNLFLISREAFLWVPFYFFLLIFVIVNFKKKGSYWALALMATAAISNYISSNIIKPCSFRIRPCHEPLLAEHIRLLAQYCGQNFSFTSSHAVNHFAISVFIYKTFRHHLSKWWALIFVWSFLICYAQVYVGVHYPTDVIGGAIIGSLIGYGMATIYNREINLG